MQVQVSSRYAALRMTYATCHSEPAGQRASRFLEPHVTVHRLGDPSGRYAALRMTYPTCHSEPAAKRMRSNFVQQRAGEESLLRCASSADSTKQRSLRLAEVAVIARRFGDPSCRCAALRMTCGNECDGGGAADKETSFHVLQLRGTLRGAAPFRTAGLKWGVARRGCEDDGDGL